MTYRESPLTGCFVLTPTRIGDERGFFSRFLDAEEVSKQLGYRFEVKQINNSLSAEKGTLRGLHYQVAPNGEVKYLRAIAGAVLDIAVDLRKDSPTFLQSFTVTLTAENREIMLVPTGFAHGFMTLEPNTEVIYAVSQTYSKDDERVLRWNDPVISLNLPFEPAVLSPKDAGAPDYSPEWHASGYAFGTTERL